jgi:hypothetical protein
MQSHQDALDALAKCTVAIREAGDGSSGSNSSSKVLGTGVIVTDDGLILTCFHVVGDIKNKTIRHSFIDVYFPEFKITKSARVVNEYCDPSLDVAFFKIEDGLSLPEKTVVSSLSEGIIFGHKFASIGFRKPQVFEKLSSSGEIRIKTSFKTKDGDESPQLIQLYSDEIEGGMSGAPVLDLEINKVVGIISEHWVTSGNVDTKLNFAIPVSSIIEKPSLSAASIILKEKNPGLVKINEFLRKIGEELTKKYERIDDLYVPPTNYDDIKEALCKDRILFISGTQEYGKTYTAVHLLWEYFNKGYEPVWFEGAERKEELLQVLRENTTSSISE